MQSRNIIRYFFQHGRRTNQNLDVCSVRTKCAVQAIVGSLKYLTRVFCAGGGETVLVRRRPRLGPAEKSRILSTGRLRRLTPCLQVGCTAP